MPTSRNFLRFRGAGVTGVAATGVATAVVVSDGISSPASLISASRFKKLESI